MGSTLGFSLYFNVYPSSRHDTDTITPYNNGSITVEGGNLQKTLGKKFVVVVKIAQICWLISEGFNTYIFSPYFVSHRLENIIMLYFTYTSITHHGPQKVHLPDLT